MDTPIQFKDIVHWGKSTKPYVVWVIRGEFARIADPAGKRNYRVAVDRLTRVGSAA
jgi:hypothetical protein